MNSAGDSSSPLDNLRLTDSDKSLLGPIENETNKWADNTISDPEWNLVPMSTSDRLKSADETKQDDELSIDTANSPDLEKLSDCPTNSDFSPTCDSST
jgi:hypothetical protein